MSSIRDMPGNWRKRLQPASFAGVEFHVESDTRASGRRTVTHEYPKRNDPYAEDMGRVARRFSVRGYLIGSDYLTVRDRLIAVLEKDGPDILRLPLPVETDMSVMVDGPYNLTTTRERGGYCEFEANFVEAGVSAFNSPEVHSPSTVDQSATTLEGETNRATTEVVNT